MKKTMLLAVLLMLGLAAAAFGQPGATFVASTESVTTVVKSGHTELTGDIYLTVATPSPVPVAGTFTLQYSVPVTSPVPGGIDLSLSSLVGVTVNTDSSGPDGMVVINVPPGGASGQYIRIHGVRVDAHFSSTSTVSVSITSNGNAVQNGQFTANVINGMKTGLLPTEDNVVVTINGLVPEDKEATIVLKEGFLNAFGKTEGAVPGDPTQTTSQIIRIQLSGPPPAGATIVFPMTVEPDAVGGARWELVDADGDALADVQEVADDASGGDLEVYYKLVSNNLPTVQEFFVLSGIEVNAADADLPVPAGTITYRATLALNEAAFTSKGTVAGLPIPRYEEDWLPWGDLVIFKGNTTALLIPLAQNMPSIGYDTGIAIANTTTDPGEAKMGIDHGAIKQSGKITFYMYQQQDGATAPKLFTYTTNASSPGTGLDAQGNLPSGSTYTVLASEIATAAGGTAEFQGYVIAVTNFTNAHGLYVCSNFTTFSQGSPMMVIDLNRQDVPEHLGQ